jgi:predicted MFS family arabinose efflux permease
VASFGAMTGFYLLLSVVPLYAESVGAGGVGAGLVTGALMATTVAGELAIPRLLARFGHRALLAAGLVLLGAPALALPAASTMAAILAVSVVRGLGFAICVVVGGALVAALVPPERRGEGLGLFGIVVGVPGVAALPLGVWLVGEAGYPPVFVAGAVAALAGLAVVPGLPGRQPAPEQPPVGVLAGLRTPALVRPALAFSATAMAAGVVVTFLPLAVPGGSGGLAALALFVQAVGSTLSRWWAGRFGDRHGPAVLFVPGVGTAAAGILCLVLIDRPAAVLAAMALFGAGFGATQNASMTLMLNRVAPPAYGTVSAIWNLAFDAGIGVGAFGFGVVAARTGYPPAFAVTAALMLAGLVLRPARPVRPATTWPS